MSEPVGNSPRGGAIPGNSHKEREQNQQEAAEETREKAEKIVEGKVVTRKAPWWKRAARGMVAGDVQNIGDYILVDVLVPAAKNLIRDIIVGGTDRALYGTSVNRGGVGPAFGLRGDVGGIRTKYDKMATGGPGEPRRVMSRESQARHDFDEVTLSSREEAYLVVEELINRCVRYGAASVSDLYDMLGVTGSFMDRKWGWTDLSTANVRQHRGGWVLDLPRPEPLR